MQSVTVEQDYGDPSGSVVQVCFPSVQTSVLDSLNRQREEGHLCDLSIHVQGQVFKAHRCVLAASSPYFHDQVLLKNMSTVSIPAAMDPLAFESVLSCAYTGQLRMLRDDIVNYLTVGSVLQMWHIVDKCTELLREARGGSSGPRGTGEKTNAGLSSCANKLEKAWYHSTPTYCTPSGGEEGFLLEEEEDDELLFSRNREREGGKRKNSTSVSDQEVGVSDSFGVSSYQGGDATPPQRRPSYSQPSIMPRKQWVVVKTENSRDDDLIVVSGEEGGEDEEEREMEMVRERDRAFNISNVRTLSGLREQAEQAEMEAQGDYCQSSEDYLKFERGLLEQTSSHHHPSENPSQCTSRAVSALLSSVQSTSARAQLFPLDMQGNQIFLYNQAALESTSPLGHAGGIPIKSSLEHGAVPLPGQSALGSGIEGLDAGGAGGPGKVFMCHCGKTFTHKSMRDRHINMHLDLRPFHCPVCSKKFKMKHHLTEHMKTHTGLKPYDCHACGKKFMWRDSFMRHRSHCERRSLGANSADGSIISPPHHLKLQTSVGETTQSRSVVSVNIRLAAVGSRVSAWRRPGLS
ncbi:Zinc finger and BTB domain-containing protein 22 [Triplophysa tibetana]|uniref:Zinc finger and BTB domain-containing protein 22 n=1 Tax=Triplophysa tibetana TaxID=1572043 RepID=A0A5A9NLB2_9TELE|nr:Zinc finger and BTB domain-containing protein 22 [Triplophysa tibetana]